MGSDRMSPYDPEYVHELLIEVSPEERKQIASRYKRMCPQCGCVEGPSTQKSIIIEDNSGAVWCKNCGALLAYFEIWDMQAQTKLAKSWCCKHPQAFRKGIGILDNRVVSYGRHCNVDVVRHSKHCICKERKGLVVYLDKWCRWEHREHHPTKCQCTFSEASWDTAPNGFHTVNKYICFKCLTVVTRRTEDMDRNDVTWSKFFLDLLPGITSRNVEGMKMGNWIQAPDPIDEPKRIKGKEVVHPPNVDKVDEYPLTLEEYMELPYLVNMHRDLQQFGALVIELNLIVHADSQQGLEEKVKEEMEQWFKARMEAHEHIPLPAGYEVHNGKVRRTPGTMGAAIPIQYQKYGRIKG